jgi:hypothetical protein
MNAIAKGRIVASAERCDSNPVVGIVEAIRRIIMAAVAEAAFDAGNVFEGVAQPPHVSTKHILNNRSARLVIPAKRLLNDRAGVVAPIS